MKKKKTYNLKNYWKGKHLSEEHKKKISNSLKGKIYWRQGKVYERWVGEKNPNWNAKTIGTKYSREYTDKLREKIRKRDNYVCRVCGTDKNKRGHINQNLHCHHIDYDKQNCNPNNLITLCINCHAKTYYKIKRDYWKKFLKQLVINSL